MRARPAAGVLMWVLSASCTGDASEPAGADAAPAVDAATWVSFPAQGGVTTTVDALFRRPAGSGPHPAVVYSHGKIVEELGYEGAAARGYDVADFVDAFAAAGYVAVAPIRPAAVSAFSDWRDMTRGAEAFLAAQTGVDPARIFLAGYSKGGLLTVQVAIEDDSDLAGVVLLSAAGGAGEHGWTAWATDGNLLRLDVAVLATVGSAETGEIPSNLAAFEADMARLGRPIDSITFGDPAATHEWFHQVRDEYWPAVVAWLDEH